MGEGGGGGEGKVNPSYLLHVTSSWAKISCLPKISNLGFLEVTSYVGVGSYPSYSLPTHVEVEMGCDNWKNLE